MSEKLNEEILEALDCLCDTYLANRGTKSEFVSCITPGNIPWYWVRAKQAVERGRAAQKDKKKNNE